MQVADAPLFLINYVIMSAEAGWHGTFHRERVSYSNYSPMCRLGQSQEYITGQVADTLKVLYIVDNSMICKI